MVCCSCDNKHKIMHRDTSRIKPEDMGPLMIVLTDHNFPACLPTISSGECVKIIRVEDASLETLTKKLFVITKGYVVPAGTVVTISSLSHLHAVGLEAYCADMVAALDSIWQKYRGAVTTVQGLPLVNADVSDAALINNAFNAYRWYISVLPKRGRYFHKTAKVAYRVYTTGTTCETQIDDGDRWHLPRSLLPNSAGALVQSSPSVVPAALQKKSKEQEWSAKGK